MQSSENILAQTAPPKVLAVPSSSRFSKDTKIGHFLKFFKGGTKGKSQKKEADFGGSKIASAQTALPSNWLKCNHRRTSWRKPRIQKCSQCRVLADLAKTSKSAIFWNSSKRGPRENRKKRRPTLGARKSPRRKRRYLLINIRLKCNHRRTFWRKPRLQKCSQCRVLADLAKTPKSAIFWNSSKGGPRENRKKRRRTSGAQKTPRRKLRYLLSNIRLKCNYQRASWRKPRLQKCSQCRVLADLAKTPKSAIFWNSSKGGPRENRKKRRPTSGARKSPRRQRFYLLINIRLKCIHRRTSWRKPRLQKCSQCRVLADLAKTPKSAIFWNSSKGGPRENRKKKRPTSGARKSPRRKRRYLLINIRFKCNHRRTFWSKPRLQKCSQCRVLADLAKTPKSAIFWNSSKGGPRENRKKRRPTSGARKSTRCKRRYLLINIHLKCNHRRTFWRKPRLQKCSQCRVLADLAKTPKSAIFWNSSKGGPRENRKTRRPTSGARKLPRRQRRYFLFNIRLKCNHRRTSRRKPRLQKCSQCRVLADLAKTPKSAIFWNSSKGGPRENRKTRRPTSGARKSPRRQRRYLLSNIRLKCNHRKTSWRKPRLQMCSQCWFLADLAKTPKSANFLKFFKGGTKGKSQKKEADFGGSKIASAQTALPSN